MATNIIIIKPGSLSPNDKGKLTKAGHIVIESEKAHEIIFKSEPGAIKYTHLNCYTCGDRIYITEERLAALRKSSEMFFCPQGHAQSFKK